MRPDESIRRKSIPGRDLLLHPISRIAGNIVIANINIEVGLVQAKFA